MTTGRRAIALTPMETRLDVIMRAAELADELGYEAFQLAEGWGLDATLLLAQLVPTTRRINMVTSVLSIWGRTPATLAMGATTLHATSGGRHILGLGASSPALVEGLHDRVFERPSQKLREVATAVRNLLDGGRCVLTASPHARPLRLGLPSAPELPIWLAAVGPRSVRVAAEIADGWCPAWMSRERLTSLAPGMAEARSSAGLRSRPLTIAAGPFAVAADSPTEARNRVAGVVAWYTCAMGEWAQLVAAQGHAAEVASVRAANPRLNPTSGLVPSDAAALLDTYTAHGTAADVRAPPGRRGPAAGASSCIDEKSRVQALDRTAPALPILPGVPEKQTHNYVRKPPCSPARGGHPPGRAGLSAAAPASGVPAVPQTGRQGLPEAQAARHLRQPRHLRQLCHPQTRCSDRPAGPQPADHPALHPHLEVVAEPGRDLLRDHHPASHPPRHLRLGPRADRAITAFIDG